MNKTLLFLFFLFLCPEIHSQTVDFTYQSTGGSFCTPATIQFTQNCTGNPVGFTWDFGNGKAGYAASETITYNAPGTYTVTLTAMFNNQILKVSKNIVINPSIKANISVDRNYICLPGVINFTGSTNGNIANYQWDFGDGTALINTPSTNTNHNFTTLGTFTVKLRATDVGGCFGDTSIIVEVKKPVVTATATPSRGCVPATAVFTANAGVPPGSSVTSYTWDYGDGSPQFVTTTNTTNHLYSVVGIYSPKLTVTTTEGCTSTYNFQNLSYGIPPVGTIAYPKTPIICASENALFVAKGTNANRYFWSFGDGTTLSTTDTIVSHKYKTLGVKSVGVVSYFNDCPGTFIRTSVNVIGVIADYTASNSCIDKNAYSFANTSQGNVSSSLWKFGDGVQQANTNIGLHSYASSGEFSSSLIVNDINTGCADTSYKTIYTAKPNLFSATANICKNDSVTFSIAGNYTDTAATYTWHILGSVSGPDSSAEITVKATTIGSFNNFVVINRGPQLCPDTVTSFFGPFIVGGPNLNFTSPAISCLNNPLIITNNSQPFVAADTVRYWYWNYGNSVKNDTVYQPAPFKYTIAGTYNIALVAVDKNGCSDTLTRVIDISPSPFLNIIPKYTNICAGQMVTMIAVTNDNIVWSPGNSLSCITCDTTIASPQTSTKYVATVSNTFNCSVQDSSFIVVNTPFTAAPSSGNASICKGETVTLDAIPKGKKIVWSPANTLSNTNIYNPVATPLQSTTYTAVLSDSAGCFSSNTSFDVYVKQLPVVDAGPDKFYPKGTSFTFAPSYGNNVSTYSWTPPDLLSCSDCPIPNGVATHTQKYIVKVSSDSGCVASDSVTIKTECKSADLYMPKAFTPNNDNLNDFYYPMSKSFTSIAAFTIYNRAGKIIYTAHNFPPNDKSFGWNGKFMGKAQSADTYVYTLEAICEIGEKVFIKGSFILLR